MNEQTNPLDTLQIDRLIDGELDSNARKELHLQAEETTGAWRQIALAYIESQHWQGSFSQLLTEPVTSPEVVSASPEKSRLVPVMVWGVVVASLFLLVGGMSYRMGKTKGEQFVIQQHQNIDNTVDKIVDDVALQTKSEIHYVTTYYQPETTMLQFQHPDTGEITEQVAVIIDPENRPVHFDEWISLNEGELTLPADVLQKLKEKGVTATAHRKFYSLPLENGLQAIVPVDTSTINYTINDQIEYQ